MLPARTMSSGFTRTESHGLVLCNISGFWLAFKGALTFLFFRSSPQTGAGVTVALTLSWLLLIAGYTILDSPATSSISTRSEIPRWILIYLGSLD